MALSVELITGHADDNHVTSFDARAFNRATLGKGKYILQDADNLRVQISGLTGTIQISAGSCLWSGMHIKVEEEGVITYTTPATTDYVYVWLHYLRNPETLVESVDFVTTTGTRPDSALITDTLTDEATEAYTLFCSFTHDVSTNTAQGESLEFSLRTPLDDSAKEQSNSLSAMQSALSKQVENLSKDLKGQISSLSGKVDTSIAENNAKVNALSSDILTKIGTNLVNLGSGKLNETFDLSEPIENFTFIGIQVGYSYVEEFKVYPVSFVQTTWFDHMITFAAQKESTLNVITFRMYSDVNGFASNRFRAFKISAKSHSDEGTLGGGYTQKDIDPSKITVRVFGIAKIEEAE